MVSASEQGEGTLRSALTRAGGRLTPARLLTSPGGTRWLAVVVARLSSEGLTTGEDRARLILRFECLTRPGQPARMVTARASRLEELDDEALRALASGRGQ